MKYDLTTLPERKGHDAIAVDAVGIRHWGFEPGAPDEGYDFIPMWVADMNFLTCPAITDALMKRVQTPTFGYFLPRDEYFEEIIRWQSERNGAKDLTREAIGYENGVHGFISSVVDTFTEPGDTILLHRPYYVGFMADIRGKGRKAVYSDLVQDSDGIWRMDYEDMDRKIRENNVKLAVFCSPHNPTGRVWTREELEAAMAVFEKNNVLVVSDEIWADIVLDGNRHIPTQNASAWARQHVLAAYAPSKTFNLAGLIGSYHIIYNEELRSRVERFSEGTHYNEMNMLSMYALLGAYSREGAEWADELRQVLAANCRWAVDFINTRLDGVKVTMPQGTYMLFLDFTEFCERTGHTINEVIEAGWRVGVGWQDGRKFGGPCHIRMNLALPEAKVKEAFGRLLGTILSE